MKRYDFYYWLRGFFELREKKIALNSNQIRSIKEHHDLMLNTEKHTEFDQWFKKALSFAENDKKITDTIDDVISSKFINVTQQ